MSRAFSERDDWLPLDDETHALQLRALDELCRREGVERAIDLGCGDGRVARAMQRVRVLGLDIDPGALSAISADDPRVETRLADALDASTPLVFGDSSRAQGAWCLGNTFLEFHDVARAAAMMRRLREALDPPGWLAIDNFVADIWRDVAEGNWQEGVSDDDQWQMVWAPGDEIVALRRGPRVDPDDWSIREHDRLLRLWSLGSLRLLALSSGWTAPEPDPTGALLLFRPV